MAVSERERSGGVKDEEIKKAKKYLPHLLKGTPKLSVGERTVYQLVWISTIVYGIWSLRGLSVDVGELVRSDGGGDCGSAGGGGGGGDFGLSLGFGVVFFNRVFFVY